ncbi:MAG: hypothetical protein ACRDJ5_04090 [Actinomycetota bacterium]
MGLKKILALVLWGFVLFFLVQAPAEAGRLVRATGETAGEWFGAVSSLLVDLLNGVFP